MKDKIVKIFCESIVDEAKKAKPTIMPTQQVSDSYDSISSDIVSSAKRVKNSNVDQFLKLFANIFDKKGARKVINKMVGFINQDGSFVKVGGHEDYAEKQGFNSSIDLIKASGMVRWSPETESLTFGKPLSDAQREIMKIIADIYDDQDSGELPITVECVNAESKYNAIELEIPATMQDQKSSYYDIVLDKLQREWLK